MSIPGKVLRPLCCILCIAGLLAVSATNLLSMVSHAKKEMAAAKILKFVSGYEVSGGYYADIYYTDKDGDYVDTIIRIIDTYYPVLMKDFDLSMDTKGQLPVVIYPDSDALSHAVGIDYNEKPPMGVYYGGIINLVSPDTWVMDESESGIKDTFMKDGPVIHELCHYFLEIKTGGNYETWFTEGVALYYENKYTGFEWRPDLKGSGEGISAGDMAGLFRSLDEAMAYRCAFELIFDYTGRNSEEALREIYNELGSGQHFSAVLYRLSR